VLDKLDNPDAVTLEDIIENADSDFQEWLKDRRNRQVGWKMEGRRTAARYLREEEPAAEGPDCGGEETHRGKGYG